METTLTIIVIALLIIVVGLIVALFMFAGRSRHEQNQGGVELLKADVT